MKHYYINEGENRIDIFNERWYFINGKNYRNVTTILDIVDKGEGYRQYLKQSGFRADYILAKAGEFGEIFHELTARHDSHQVVDFNELNSKYNDEVSTQLWERFVRYCEYIEELENLEILHIEKIVWSDKYEYAGTTDRIVKLNDKYELWDIKTGGLYPIYFQQLAAYKFAIKESLGIDCEIGKILWFPDKKVEVDEDGKTKYHPNKKGYRIVSINNDELNFYFDMFLASKKLFDLYHKDEPKYLTLPVKIHWEKK